VAFLGEHQARRQWAGAAVALAGTAAIAAAVFLGVAPSAAGFALWAYAMARMDVGRATLSLYRVPAAAIVISLIWLSQLPGPVQQQARPRAQPPDGGGGPRRRKPGPFRKFEPNGGGFRRRDG